MDFISTLMVDTPSSLWTSIIGFFESGIANFALVIILLTICIKLVMSPLDFLNKKVARDNSRMQAVIAPQMAKLQKQYGHDKNLLNQKTAELYKSNGFSMGSSCIVMLTYLILTIVIFFTLFSTLMGSTSYRIEKQYLDLREAYVTTQGTTEEKQNAVLELYDQRDSKFLWVQNVWFPDNPWTQSVPTFDEYLSLVGDKVKTDNSQTESTSLSALKAEDQSAYETFIADFRDEYNEVMLVVQTERGGVNGYLITALLAVGTAFLSQYLMQRKNLSRAQAEAVNNQPGMNKAMLIIMPVVMGLFTLFYNAVFGMYIIAGQIVSMLTFPIFDKILDKIDAKKQKKAEEKIKVDYSRK